MADQVVDRRTVGIPADVEVVRYEVEAMRDSASDSMEASARSAESAQASEAAAALSARTAATLVSALNGLRVGSEEPELHSRTDRMLWLDTTRDLSKVSRLMVWDGKAAGAALWPSSATWPGRTTYPMVEGTWVQTRLGSACIG